MVVPGDDEVLDDVQEVTTKTIASRDRSFASCEREERWLENSDTSARCRASANAGDTERSGKRRLTHVFRMARLV
jgi:hypothetical protein